MYMCVEDDTRNKKILTRMFTQDYEDLIQDVWGSLKNWKGASGTQVLRYFRCFRYSDLSESVHAWCLFNAHWQTVPKKWCLVCKIEHA